MNSKQKLRDNKSEVIGLRLIIVGAVTMSLVFTLNRYGEAYTIPLTIWATILTLWLFRFAKSFDTDTPVKTAATSNPDTTTKPFKNAPNEHQGE